MLLLLLWVPAGLECGCGWSSLLGGVRVGILCLTHPHPHPRVDLRAGGRLVHHWLDVPASPRPSRGRPDAVQAPVPNPPDGEEVGHGGVHVRPQRAPQRPRPGEAGAPRCSLGPSASCLLGSSVPPARVSQQEWGFRLGPVLLGAVDAAAPPQRFTGWSRPCFCLHVEPFVLPIEVLFSFFARVSAWNKTFYSWVWAWQIATLERVSKRASSLSQ